MRACMHRERQYTCEGGTAFRAFNFVVGLTGKLMRVPFDFAFSSCAIVCATSSCSDLSACVGDSWLDSGATCE